MSTLIMSSTVYLSSRGIASVRAELEQLTGVERPVVIARIAAARELGDLRENAEYETARKEQSILEGRINRLTALLRDAVQIEGSSTSDRRPRHGHGRFLTGALEGGATRFNIACLERSL